MTEILPPRIKVLHLEDEPKDSRLIRSTLAADGLECDFVRVDTESGFRTALTSEGFDVILADHSLPTFDGISALALAKECSADVPFICVSGSLGEELAIDALKNGATDYVLKHRLSRLGPAVRRALQESAERAKRKEAEAEIRKLESQLRHSQKLEAVGQLAGGIAHDFNNLLTVVNGYCDRLLARVGDESPLRDELDLIQRAGQRATALTRQLLAFSRRQVLQPRVIELNTIVLDMDKMLRRLIGEPITILTALDPKLDVTRADPGQMEQVIMNLAINARDAMPQGGTLTIETGNLEVTAVNESPFGLRPGRYVSLVVRDTGHGMDQETLSHIFEPFFTTKEVGKGTGLGLPTVYGIVMQSGGDIFVESEPGQGTATRVFLPRAEGAVHTRNNPASSSAVTGGNETLLLVEDEDLVRELVREFLESAGYRVLEAHDGEEALRIAESGEHAIDLLVTDVVLPGMNGSEAAAHLKRLLPRLKTVYISGYPGDAAFRNGSFDPGSAFLAKPFTRHVLTQKVREILDETPETTGTVMVIDDDAGIRGLLTQTLSAAGYTVVDRPASLDGATSVDVALIDVASNDPKRLAELKSFRRRYPMTQVVLMAGAFGDRILKEAQSLGVAGTLQKPLAEPRVLDAVRLALTAGSQSISLAQ